MLKSVAIRSATAAAATARGVASLTMRASATMCASRLALSMQSQQRVRYAHAAAAAAPAAKPCPREAFVHPRDALVETLTRIYRHKMTTTSGGNLSMIDANGDVWITPAGVDKGTLTRKDIICVHLDGTFEGPHKPSSEYPFHRAIYNARPEFKAIVHAHPTALVAYSACRVTPETKVLHQAHSLCGTPLTAGYGCPGTQVLANKIGAAFSAPEKPVCVMLDNHGVVVGGESLRAAFDRFETLEFTANTLVKAKQLAGGEVRMLTETQLASVPRVCNMHACGRGSCGSPAADVEQTAPSARENELRLQLSTFIRRGYTQGLFIASEGSFSARLDKNSFVISTYGMDRAKAEPSDFVVVKHNDAGVVQGIARNSGKAPSRAAHMHATMYARHPAMGAIVNACPANATAFGATSAVFDTRTIPEAYLFLRDVKKVPFGVQFANRGAELASLVTPREPIALIENDGVIVTGKDVLHVFDRLEVLEATAEALVKTLPVGKFVAMSAEATTELNDYFAAFLEKMATV